MDRITTLFLSGNTDCETTICTALDAIAPTPGHPPIVVDITHTIANASARLDADDYDVLLLELELTESSGLDTLTAFRTRFLALPILVISPNDDHEVALSVVRHGAQDYLACEHVTAPLLDRCIRHAVERHSLEAQLVQSQKMEAVGRLAGEVAHDFSNLLTIIAGNIDLLENPGDTELSNSLATIRRASQQAEALTEQLLTVSRRKVMKPAVLNLSAIITELQPMLNRLLGKDIRLVTELEVNLRSIVADRGQLDQVIMNLIVNARDAIEDGGTVTISTTNFMIVKPLTMLDNTIEPGEYVSLTVSDTGCGIKRDQQRKIFEPFFTTKAAGKGTGLGLSIAYGIVKQCNGSIQLESEVGKGSSFKLFFPQAQLTSSPVTPLDRDAVLDTVAGSETILVVEDGEMLQKLIARALTAAGYHVFQATTAPAALAICDQHGGPIDLLLVDLVLPGGFTGIELADKLRPKYPGVKVLLTSGYSQQARDAGFESGIDFLEKPFTVKELQSLVRQMLNRDDLQQ